MLSFATSSRALAPFYQPVLMVYIKAFFDLVTQAEFFLDVMVLLLVKRFARDFTLEQNGYKSHTYESLASLRNQKFISQ